MLGEVVEDQLAADWRGSLWPGRAPEDREGVLAGEGVAAVGLDRLAERGETLGCGDSAMFEASSTSCPLSCSQAAFCASLAGGVLAVAPRDELAHGADVVRLG